MDAGIILGGQQPDILGAMDKGRAMAESQIGLNRQNALAELYRTQGAQIAAGDQGALNALAGMDPSAAMAAQSNLLGIQGQRQDLAFSAEEMQMKRDAAKASATEALAAQQNKLTAGQLAAEAKALSEALSGAAFFYQNKDEAGYNAFLQKSGIDPAEFPFAEFPAHAATVEGVLEAMKAFEPPAAPEWRPATPEEAAANGAIAGQINTVTGKFDAQNPPSGMALTTNPDGTLTLEQGPGVTGGGRTGKPTEGSLASEGYLQRMKGAEEVFTALEGQGTTALGWTDRPVVDTDFESLKLTEPEQQLLQAQRDWVRAKLRKESGAVIGPEEMAAEIKQYFPQPGEGPKVIAQKKEARKRAEEQLRITALLPEGAPTEAPAEVKPKRLKFNPATGELE